MNIKENTDGNEVKGKADFTIKLCKEHLDEASFLYEQRQYLLKNNMEMSWLDIGRFEDRIDAHIDALGVDENAAEKVCKIRAFEGCPGELHVATRLFCRLKHFDLIETIIEKLAPGDVTRVKAFCDALIYEIETDNDKNFIFDLLGKYRQHFYITTKLIGYKRYPGSQASLSLSEKTEPCDLSLMFWTFGRTYETNASDLLLNSLQHEDEKVCSDAAIALLRMGNLKTISDCKAFVPSNDWPLLILALGGGQSVVSLFIEKANSEHVSSDCLLALGFIGDMSAVDILIVNLNKSELAESAAFALNILTGAEIYEDVFVPEKTDISELFEDELEKKERGEDLYPPGEEPGEVVIRISQKTEDWQKWWAENKNRFKLEIRYRNGKPFSPAALLENMESENSSQMLRQFAYEEMVIRYKIDFPFDTALLVSQQKQEIVKYAKWIKSNSKCFSEGKWYFAGQL